jgi:ribosomal protein S18 acetylase RimI-like enzyme
MSGSNLDDITFGRAVEADIAGIQFTAEESWRATYQGIYTSQFITDFLANAYSTENLTRSVNSQRTTFYVAKEDGLVVVGFCHFGPSMDGERTQLYRLYVDPDYWRLGIGTHLMHLMENHLRGQGVGQYFCYVHARNEVGKAFYLRQGFVHDPALDQDNGDEWYMFKILS